MTGRALRAPSPARGAGRHRGAGRPRGLREGRALDDRAVAQEQDPVGPRGVPRVVGDDERRGARVAASPDRSCRTSSPDLVSSAPVGSSARISRRPPTSARAIATRCCCPPDRSSGNRPAAPARPTSASAASASRRATRTGTPSSSRGSATFSPAVSDPTRLASWNTKPRWRRRSIASWAALAPTVESCPIRTSPCVGWSSPPARFSSVDLPDPLGPMTATSSPSHRVSETSRSAVTAVGPSPCVRHAPTSSRTVVGCWTLVVACPVMLVPPCSTLPDSEAVWIRSGRASAARPRCRRSSDRG